jgi:hypothetical protein
VLVAFDNTNDAFKNEINERVLKIFYKLSASLCDMYILNLMDYNNQCKLYDMIGIKNLKIFQFFSFDVSLIDLLCHQSAFYRNLVEKIYV